jgi:NitT/TauT family transport system substrate-binding protein
MSEVMQRLVFEKRGLTGKIQLVATGGFGPGLTALNHGGIDATTLIDPLLTLDAHKYHKILTFGDEIPRLTWLVGVSTREFAQKNADKLRALIRVRRRAVDFIYANREEALNIYAKVWEQDRDKVAKYFPKYFNMPGEWVRGEFDTVGLKTMSDGLQIIGEVKQPVDWKSIIDQNYLPDDLRRPL